MTHSNLSVRSMVGAAAILLATATLATAYGSEATDHPAHAAVTKTLPGTTTTAQIDPCGPKKVNGPLGY